MEDSKRIPPIGPMRWRQTLENANNRGFATAFQSTADITIDVVSDPALNATRSAKTPTAESPNNSNGNTGSPNGGTDPGTSPVNSNSSSHVANRTLRTPSSCFTRFESSCRSAGNTNNRNISSVLSNSAFAPTKSGSPRTRADSSDVEAAAWSISLCSTPPRNNSSRIRSNTWLIIILAIWIQPSMERYNSSWSFTATL